MLRLASRTDPRYVDVALGAFDRVLVDHAHCEHKAAASALAFVSKFPDDPHLVVSLSALARDEAGHFARMVAVCTERGLALGFPEPDPYVQRLLSLVRRGQRLEHRVDRLLCASLIEARSCERLQLIAGALARLPTSSTTNSAPSATPTPAAPDARTDRGLPRGAALDLADLASLAPLYDELWREEAGHHTLFIELAERSVLRARRARSITAEEAHVVVDTRLRELAAHEAAIVAELPLRPAIH